MGGVAFLISVSISLIVCAAVLLLGGSSDAVVSIIICQVYAALNAGVGIIDDMKKLHRKENKGLTPVGKLGFQFVLAVLFLIARGYLLEEGTEMHFAFGDVDFGFFYYPIALVILIGIINCANLTDGIDGLASSVAFSTGVSLLYISAALNTEASAIASAIMGAAVGFLIFNTCESGAAHTCDRQEILQRNKERLPNTCCRQMRVHNIPLYRGYGHVYEGRRYRNLQMRCHDTFGAGKRGSVADTDSLTECYRQSSVQKRQAFCRPWSRAYDRGIRA